MDDKCNDLLAMCDSYLANSPTPRFQKGLERIKTLLQKELKFLSKQDSSHRCTNLSFFSSLLKALSIERSITTIYETLTQKPSMAKVRVDIISHSGLRWIKIKATSISALNVDLRMHILQSTTFESESSEGEEESTLDSDEAIRSFPLIKQLLVLQQISTQTKTHYRQPTLILRLFSQRNEMVDTLDERFVDFLANNLIQIQISDGDGLIIDETLGPFADSPSLDRLTLNDNDSTHPQTVNLDITTLITLCSNLSHYPPNLDDIRTPAFIVQSRHEIESPILPVLKSFFDGKRVVCSEYALKRFAGIVVKIAGVEETRRARSLFHHCDLVRLSIDAHFADSQDKGECREEICVEFMPKIEVVKDSPSLAFSESELDQQHRVIFGTGDYIRATTVSSNRQKIALMRDLGLDVICYEHFPRSFIEMRIVNGSF